MSQDSSGQWVYSGEFGIPSASFRETEFHLLVFPAWLQIPCSYFLPSPREPTQMGPQLLMMWMHSSLPDSTTLFKTKH